MDGINKIKQCWEEYIPKNIRIFLSSKRTLIAFILINMSLCSIAISFNNYIPHVLFGKENAEAKGKMLTTCLSIMGGLTVLYGLWLNNKKLDEQTRQNNITVESNNDKRFGDAIGYLNNDNVGIAIGGVYTLFQIAKEDYEERYKSIIVNIYLNFIAVYSNFEIKKSLYNIVVKLLLDDIFSNTKFCFENVIFDSQLIHNIQNRNFYKCKFIDVFFENNKSCKLIECNIEKCCFYNNSYLDFHSCIISDCTFCVKPNIGSIVCCKIVNVKIWTNENINSFVLLNNKIEGYLQIISPNISGAVIDGDVLLSIITNTPNNLFFHSGENLVKITNCDEASNLMLKEMKDIIIKLAIERMKVK